MTLYFAYGANMERAAMRKRCPGATALGIAGVGYDERADIQSWGQMNELFARTLAKE